ncbi:ABC transporter ATP-binding protein [Ruminococcus difficilis]|uniref:ABC transporter ATP-binding protein n=1 Tax=Ruminococcus difficilis TaxID=2763069 RepID=A0A934WQJ5_9FIRM|nr:ABC transporter ATP-binding protein [Ruminococcus difficilis]MBK6088088.1 ABC transporter ATP-binding protein [Ruminococcus difficilis]
MKNFKQILRYLKPYTVFVVFSVIFVIFEVASNVLQPKYMEQIVDDGVLQMDLDVVFKAGVMMLLVAVIGGVCGYISCVLSNIYSQRFGNSLRKTLFRKIMSLSAQQDDAYTAGSLITRMTNDTRVVTEFSSVFIQMAVKPLMLFLLGIIMVLTIDPIYGIILLVSLPVQFLIIRFFIKRSAPVFATIQKKLDRLNSFAMHIVSNNRLIKSYVRENYEAGRFDNQNRDLTSTVMNIQVFMAILNPLVMLILNTVVLAVIFIGGFQVEARMIRVGSVMAAINYSQQIMMSMMTLGGIFQYVARSKVSAERLTAVLNREPALPSGKQMIDRIDKLSLSHVSFRYPQNQDAQRNVLEDISLEVRGGECIGILGTTGSGKSTIARLLIREYDATDGQVTYNGVDVKDIDTKSLRDQVSVVFQNSDMFSASLRENITKGAVFSQEDFDTAVRSACVDEFADDLRGGYDAVISERGASLSGGQKQRVAIARALLRAPQVLVFDDCTSSLDLETEAKVLERIQTNYRDKTRIFISQRISTIMGADRIILMDDGRVVAFGSHRELFDSCELYRSIYQTQNPEGGDELE